MMIYFSKNRVFNLALFIFLFIGVDISKANSDSTAILVRDSIHSKLLLSQTDTAEMRLLISEIRKNRRKLKEYYQPLLEEYVQQSKDMSYTYGKMKSLDILGLQERFNENYEIAIEYHKQSLNLAVLLKDSSQMCYNYNNLGQAYRKQDLNSLAIQYFHRALKIQEKLGLEKSMSYTHNTIGATYLALEEYEQALLHLNESVRIAKKNNDKRTIAFNYGSIGEILLLQNKPLQALTYFNDALALKKELNYKKGMAVTYHLMGEAWFVQKNYQQAQKWFTKAIEIHKKYNNQRYLSHCFAFLGKIELVQKDLKTAKYYLNKANTYAQNVHSIENLILINKTYVDLYAEINNWKDAMQTLVLVNSLTDSLKRARYQKDIQSLEIDYQTAKKEQRIEILSAENKIKNQRLRLGIAVIVILILGLAFAYFLIITRKRTSEHKEETLRQQLLKLQMNPHFIFNALGSIQSYMYKNEPKTAARYMGNFASLTRSILNNSSNDHVSLDEEISTLRNYLELEQMRLNGSFAYHIEFDETLEIDFIQIPPMLLQPFVENSIKHGVHHMESGGNITIRFIEKDRLICAEVEDNGLGINYASNNKTSKHISMATSILKKRIEILRRLNPNLPDPVIKDLVSEGKRGTIVRVFLPVFN